MKEVRVEKEEAEEVRPLRVLSLGAGVQSTTVLLMSIAGELPPLDHAIFADTGWEPAAVYEHLDWLEGVAIEAGVKVHRVSNGNLRADMLHATGRYATMPFFIVGEDAERGMVRRQCTTEYKIKPIEKKIRELAGVAPRKRPKAVLVEQWYGISSDESHRMRDSPKPWVVNHYPLVDLRMTRHDCQLWLQRHGHTAPRSACLGCPFHSDREWRNIRDFDPTGWADAVDFDYRIRQVSLGRRGDKALRGVPYLHADRIPLAEVDLSTEEDHGQGSLFGDECQGMCGV